MAQSGGLRYGQDNVRFNSEEAKKATFFTGSYNTTTKPVDPLVVGYAFVKWIKLPQWLVDEYTEFPSITEKNLRAFNGNDDIDIGTVDAQAGFTGNTSQFAGAIGSKGQGFSMTHNEYSGSPVRRAFNYWASSIRDPHSGIATYPGEYSARNHSGELLYIVTKPNVKNYADDNIIEYASLYTNVMPTRILNGMWNYTAGTQETPQVEMQFTADRYFGQGIDEYASTILKNGGMTAIEVLQTENVGDFANPE